MSAEAYQGNIMIPDMKEVETMKILIVNGSDHKGSTWRIARNLAEKISSRKQGCVISEIWMPRDLPEFCIGCARCVMESEKRCPHRAEVEKLTHKVDEADVLILESPVYVMHCASSMKNFLEHYAYRWMVHRPEEKMFRKQAVCIATAAGSGMRKTNTDMKDSLTWWGVPKIDTLGFAVAAIGYDHISEKKKKQIERKTDRMAGKIIRRYGHVTLSPFQKLKFEIFRLVQQKGWNPPDQKYWMEKGWTGKKRPWKE